MNPLGKLVTWCSFGSMVFSLIAMGFFRSAMLKAQGERDVARVELLTAQANERTSRGAAERCAAEFEDAGARCKAALEVASAGAERARRMLRSCVSDEAVAERLGEVTR